MWEMLFNVCCLPSALISRPWTTSLVLIFAINDSIPEWTTQSIGVHQSILLFADHTGWGVTRLLPESDNRECEALYCNVGETCEIH